MKNSALLSIAALSSCSLAAISMGFTKGHGPKTTRRHLLKRSTILEELGNNFTGQSYMATVTVGTPPQEIALAIDTGSSDTWVLDSKADLCTDEAYQAEEQTGCQTAFNSGDSSTYKLFKRDAFHITYGDGSGADGDYFTDNFALGDDVSIKALTMGIAHNANLTQGLLGIGYSLNEASNYDDPRTLEDESFVYPNLIDEMVSQKLIDINAYSLYLNDLSADTGSILFGGLDSDKFEGDLVQMPIVPRTLRNGSEIYSEFGVAITSFAIGGKDISPSVTPAAILDSGTSLTYLPTTLASDIVTELDAYDDTFGDTGLLLINCDKISSESSKTIDFGFGGTGGSDSVTVKVPLDEMILYPDQLGFSLRGYLPSDITWTLDNTCILGIIPTADEPYILGDTFLRSAYVVYDLKNNLVAIAQTNFNSTTSSIIDFKADQTAIPAVSGVAKDSGVQETGTEAPGGQTPTGKASGRETGGPNPTGSSSNPGVSATKSPSAAVASVPSLDLTRFFVLGGSALIAMLGGGLFLL